MYENFSSINARGLVSIQVLATLNIYYGGSTEISRQALSEFLHNMSHQALNKDNCNVFMQFDRMTELIDELIFVLLDRNIRSLNIANVINNNINNEINDCQFTFDVPTETEIQKDMKEILTNPPTPPPPYVPPPLLTEKEIEIERNKANEDFIEISLLMSKDELDVANESDDQKDKKNN